MELQAIITKALDIAEDVIFGNEWSGEVYVKESTRDFATEIDLQVERKVVEFLSEAMPEVAVVGEEFTPEMDGDMPGRYWVIDPIDGTANFSRDVPLFGVCIALVEGCQAIASGISLPMLKERYYAERGCGAFLNGEKIAVSDCVSMDKAIACLGDFAVGKDKDKKNKIRYNIIQRLGDEVLRVRMPGSAAFQLAWLAAGRTDISITMSNKAWDVQAGVLLVREAGGQVFDSRGEEHSIESNETLATNNLEMKNKVLDIIGKCNVS